MSEGELGRAGSITVEQLSALNEEIRALVRAGVPLERGLITAARDLGGRLGRITSALGTRLSRGESLVEALDAEKDVLPPLYRAVVEAGAGPASCRSRSKGSPGTFAAIPRLARRSGWRCGIRWWFSVSRMLLLVAMVSLVVPRFLGAFESLGLSTPAPLRWLAALGQTAEYWWMAGPILLAVLAVAWHRSGVAARFQATSWSWLKAFPWMRSILANYETANFCELLALLLEHHVTYPEALKLAAESTGNSRLVRAARSLAEAINRGEDVAAALGAVDQKTFLPMLRWVLATGQAQGSLAGALRNLAGHYRKRANTSLKSSRCFYRRSS